jgi:hypothetical protein
VIPHNLANSGGVYEAKNSLYRLDVDDTQYHGAALNKASGELINFKCGPTLKGLLGQLARVRKHFHRHAIQVVYEASYIGFTMQRDLVDKGIKTIFALTMITEIGDIQRFPHPRQLVSRIGMDIREYSSGGKHNRFGITKHGNRVPNGQAE